MEYEDNAGKLGQVANPTVAGGLFGSIAIYSRSLLPICWSSCRSL